MSDYVSFESISTHIIPMIMPIMAGLVLIVCLALIIIIEQSSGLAFL